MEGSDGNIKHHEWAEGRHSKGGEITSNFIERHYPKSGITIFKECCCYICEGQEHYRAIS